LASLSEAANALLVAGCQTSTMDKRIPSPWGNRKGGRQRHWAAGVSRSQPLDGVDRGLLKRKKQNEFVKGKRNAMTRFLVRHCLDSHFGVSVTWELDAFHWFYCFPLFSIGFIGFICFHLFLWI
jgi:hypothetical protein